MRQILDGRVCLVQIEPVFGDFIENLANFGLFVSTMLIGWVTSSSTRQVAAEPASGEDSANRLVNEFFNLAGGGGTNERADV